MEQITANVSGKARRESVHGRDHLVAPVTLLRSQVLAGSRGALYYPADEIAASADGWNGVPITLGHPTVNGKPVSGRTPAAWKSLVLGHVFNATADGEALRGEGWFDVEATRRLSPALLKALEAGEPVEVSTGLFVEAEPAPEGAVHNGRPYTHVARRYRSDHLAVLLDAPGACSVADGCGVFNEALATNPLAHEHAARVADPGEFRKDTFRRKEITAGVSVILAKRPGSDAMEVQSYRFDAEKFTAAEARAWLKKHEVDARLEPAKKDGMAANQQPSHDELRDRLSALVAEQYGPPASSYGMPEAAAEPVWVEAVYDRYLIYRQGESCYRLAYTTDLRTGAVELSGDPVEVVRTVSYRPVQNESQPAAHAATNGGPDVAEKLTAEQRKALVEGLTANCNCPKSAPWKALDAAALNAMSDGELMTMDQCKKAMMDMAKEQQAMADNARRAAAPPPAPAAAPAPAAPPVARPLTPDEWLAAAPPQVQAVVRNAIAREQQEIAGMVAALTANLAEAQRPAAAAVYAAMPAEQLRTLAAALPPAEPQRPAVNWLGAFAPPAARRPAEEPLAEPVYNWARN